MSKTLNVERGTDSQPRLVRSSPHQLEIIGRRCGIQRPWEKEPCGGKLRVEDFHPKGVRGWRRYEIYCEKCHTCDPNGWARQDEILHAAREHFHALPDTANDQALPRGGAQRTSNATQD